VTALFAEITGRCNFGEGVLWLATYEVCQFNLVDPRFLSTEVTQNIKDAFAHVAKRKPLPIIDEIKKTDRNNLDDIIFDVLNLTQGERDAVYEAVINLVESRLKKAGSV